MGIESLALMAASAALSAGGSMIAQSEANNNAENQAAARMQALREYQAKMKSLREQNYQTVDERLKDYSGDNQNARLDNASDSRTEAITQNAGAPATTEASISGTAPSIVKTEIAGRMKDAMARATDKAKALGTLGGYSDQWFNNGVDLLDTSRKLDTNNAFGKQETALLPSYQSMAEYQAYTPSSGLGQAMYGLGQIGASYAGSKAGK